MPEFPTNDKLIKQEQAPKEIEIDQCFARPSWVSDTKRYWISRNKHGYVAHLQVLVPGSRGGESRPSWCYIYTENPGQNLYTKRLSGCVSRIEKMIDLSAKASAKAEDVAKSEAMSAAVF